VSEIESELVEMGYQVLAVTPTTPDGISQALEESGYSYQVFSDADLSVTDQFGLVWHLSDETVEKYVEYGIDLEAESGLKHHNLPVPAAYLIGKDGAIDFAYVNPDHTTRVSSEVLLAAARSAAAQAAAE
jgi:peroxiredoxin